MAIITSSYWRDANSVPITTDGIVTQGNIKVLTGNNTTVQVPIFTVTGHVEARAIWGIVTTTLGVNHTAAYWRMNDGTNTPAITLATGTTCSAAGVGSALIKITNNGSALTLLSSSATRFLESAANHMTFQCFDMVSLLGGTSNIEYVYSTTDTPTSGAIQFYLRWIPMSPNANVTAL